MEILQRFVRTTKDKEIKLSTFVAINEKVVAEDLVSKTKEEYTTEDFIKDYWIRIFQHVKKQYNTKDKKFINDKENVNWLQLNEKVLTFKTRNAEARIKQLAQKRRKIHCELYLQADKEVAQLLVGESSTGAPKDDEIDNFFNSGPSFSILDVKNKINNWREAAQKIDPLHKQDLLFYNILDFVTSCQDVGIKTVLQVQYSSIKEHLSTLFSIDYSIDEEVNLLLQLVGSDNIKITSKEAIRNKNEANNKPSNKFTKIYELIGRQFKDDINPFIDPAITEYHFIMVFVFPVFYELFYDISQKDAFQRWGEAKLYCAKRNEHNSLLDAERRTPGPSVDAIFVIPFLSNIEFFIIEVSGAPAKDDFEHFIGDRNKIAKNLKIMIKYIISLRTDWATYKAATLKLYGLQIYRNEVYVYSLTNPYENVYVFSREMKFSLPTVSSLVNKKSLLFMENLWKLKKMILYSSKCVEHYIMDEQSDNENDVCSNLSSPYVSPTKRKETKW